MAFTNLGGKVPPFRDGNAFSPQPQMSAPVAHLDPLFAPTQWLRQVTVTNAAPAGTNAAPTGTNAVPGGTNALARTGQVATVTAIVYQRLIDTNYMNPFITRHFVPTPTPAPPPPPTTRKVKVTYQGFYQPIDSPRQAILKVGDAFVIAKVGALIETNLFISEAALQTLTLTNLAAQTNVIPLNTQKEIEVPLK
jgi:hypothetical protein